jgi:hypothetical protein
VKAVVLAFLLVANLAAASVELAGVSIDPSGSHFVLTDEETGVSSGWIGLGDSFIGYNVVSFDAKAEVLDVMFKTSTLHLHLRSPAKVLPPPLSPEEKQHQLLVGFHAKILAHDFSYDDLVLADVTVNGSFVFVTPREVWKGTKFTPGAPMSIPRDQFMGGVVGTGLWILGYSSGSPNGPDSPSFAQGTDGITAGGIPAGIPLDDFRAYKNGASQLPDPTSPPVTPPVSAGGAPSVAADH